MKFRPHLLLLLCCCLPAAASLADLTPDNLLLVANKNSPDSLRLAQLYATARKIPQNQIVGLDLPDAEEMDFDSYQRDVRAVLRQYLISHQLQSQITCLVTFYGVPFRVLPKFDTQPEAAELASLKVGMNKVLDIVEPAVAKAETLAKKVDPAFTPIARPSKADDIPDLMRRASVALAAIDHSVAAIPDPALRAQVITQYITLLDQLGGNVQVVARFGRFQLADSHLTDAQRQHWLNLRDEAVTAEVLRGQLENEPFDPVARRRLRDLAASQFGALNLAALLQQQILYLTPDKFPCALDSDLALLWWDAYPHHALLVNPLNFKSATGGNPAPVLMVSRLDAPTPQIVEQMIHTSIQVEHVGLQGCVAIESRGLSPFKNGNPDMYGQFDQTLRHLAEIVHDKTKLTLYDEDTGHLFQARQVKNCALYCGWYSVRQYVPGMQFNSGAVGYHVASFEMVSLHENFEAGWVHGLLTDGVVATLGSVAEPYLQSFPPPDEFFPLLMTGKLSLAEVYWKTEPVVGWQMCLIGDPLYRPYAVNPPLPVADLSAPLKTALPAPIKSVALP